MYDNNTHGERIKKTITYFCDAKVQLVLRLPNCWDF